MISTLQYEEKHVVMQKKGETNNILRQITFFFFAAGISKIKINSVHNFTMCWL
jgi:hypothetical protein